MMMTPDFSALTRTVQHNCDISDSRDNGIYSVCTLVLKLRNQYKWENHRDPWEEPDPALLLDWIEAKENYWSTLTGYSFQPLRFGHRQVDPWDVASVNDQLSQTGYLYGAGYGRSMKSVFFLAEKLESYAVEGCPVIILGKESARELASPMAMLQENMIYIRREQLRYFFWDQIQEIRSSSRQSLHHALACYDVLKDGKVDQRRFREKLDQIVDNETDMFVYHEVGEMLQQDFGSETLKSLIAAFPDSPVEFVCRALKDILADTHPLGMLAHIIDRKKESSLGFYVGFLDGLRRLLFPELAAGFCRFLEEKDWRIIQTLLTRCRENNLRLSTKINTIAAMLGKVPVAEIKDCLYRQILLPLGLDVA